MSPRDTEDRIDAAYMRGRIDGIKAAIRAIEAGAKQSKDDAERRAEIIRGLRKELTTWLGVPA